MNIKKENIGNSAIDWEQRRYEIARECMAAWDSNWRKIAGCCPQEQAKLAVEEADALIAELMKGSN